MSNMSICRPDFEVFMGCTCLINHFVDKSAGISILPLFKKLSLFVYLFLLESAKTVCEYTKNDAIQFSIDMARDQKNDCMIDPLKGR